MDSCSECFLPELKKLRLFSKQYRNTRTVDFLKVRLVEAIATAISRKVVGKSARESPERYCGWFEFTVLPTNLKEWQERPRMYVCEC